MLFFVCLFVLFLFFRYSDTSRPLCKNYKYTPGDESSQYHNGNHNGYTGYRLEQDLMHVLNSCNYSLKASRFLSRHNAVLEKIAERLSLASSIANEDDLLIKATIWADIKGWDADANFPEHIEVALRAKYRLGQTS